MQDLGTLGTGNDAVAMAINDLSTGNWLLVHEFNAKPTTESM